MEELELMDTPLTDMADMGQMLVRFLFNAVVSWVIIRFLYYPKSHRRDYYFTFSLIAVCIFMLIYLLGGVKLKMGFALGLFAIFGIIRYRTESMPVREMTYLFAVISLSVINALAVTLSYVELMAVNLLFVLCILFYESNRWLRHLSCKLIQYDRIELVKPELMDELVADLRQRTGLDIRKVEVGAMDFLRDTALLKVYYDTPHNDINTVDNIQKMPKTEIE